MFLEARVFDRGFGPERFLVQVVLHDGHLLSLDAKAIGLLWCPLIRKAGRETPTGQT